MAALDPGTIGLITVLVGIVSIIALLCGLFYKYGKLNNRIDTLERNVNTLTQETRGLVALQRDVDRLLVETRTLIVRIELHKLALEARQKSEEIREGSKRG